MPDTESRRLALYNELNRLLGSDLADTLMTYLPASAATDLATKADIARLEAEVSGMKDDVRHLSRRMDRLQQTTLGGFVAMVAALLASGFLG